MSSLRKPRRSIFSGSFFRETVFKALSGRGHLVFCRTEGGDFFVNPADSPIGKHLMWSGEWQRDTLLGVITELQQAGRLKPGGVFVDIGANIGTQTVYAMKTGLFSRAVSFEPEPRNFELLTRNVAANGLTDRVTLVNKAVSDAAGESALYLHPHNNGAHSMVEPANPEKYKRVVLPLTRLDDALKAASVAMKDPSMIWIDAEGFEPEIVSGFGDALAKRAVPLVIEYAPERYSPDRQALLNGLLTRHYKMVRRLEVAGSTPQPITSISEISSRYEDIVVF
jgi:FkbM family methyltransferase